MNKTKLRNYASLIARCGVNVQKGQDVIISCDLDQPEFVEMLVKECYKAGARQVRVEWSYQPLAKHNIRYCSDKTLATVEEWEIKKMEHMADTLPCRIMLTSSDPDGLNGINQKKYAQSVRARSQIMKPIRNRMENKYQWCIAAVAGKAWAKKLFPNVRASVAVEKLWEAILLCARADSDPVKQWEEHNKNLLEKCNYLNSLGIKELHYTASNGTDFKVGLIPDAIFMGGGEEALGSNIYYNPNIPSEEVFTSPKRGEAEGIVYSTMPLSYGGQLIENFWMRFEGGKIVETGAERGAELLDEIVHMDEGASYLGECALVPYSSPIRRSGILFYNTLFDENASCHLAFGRGFSNLIKGYEGYTHEQLVEKGINDSLVHVDFMIGTADLKIVATTHDGRSVEIFSNGEWAF